MLNSFAPEKCLDYRIRYLGEYCQHEFHFVGNMFKYHDLKFKFDDKF